MANSRCLGREKLLKKAHPVYVAYLRHCKRLGQSERTLANKRCDLYLFHQWLNGQGVSSPLAMDSKILEAFILYLSTKHRSQTGKPIGKGSISRFVGMLKSFYEFLHRERFILTNPALVLKHPRSSKQIPKDILNPDEFKRLLKTLSSENPLHLRDAVAIRILMFSGIRLSELCKLDVDDLELKTRELIIRNTKTKTDRVAFIDTSTQQWLAHYLVQARPALVTGSHKALIVTDRGKRMTASRMQDIVNRYVIKSRIRKHITPHSFRRTLCSLFLQAGINLKIISEIAGHSKLSTTARYSQVDIGTLSQIYQQRHPRA